MGTKLRAFLDTHHNTARNFADLAHIYVEKIRDILVGDNPTGYEDTVGHINFLQNIQPIRAPATLVDCINAYDTVAKVRSHIAAIGSIVDNENYLKRALTLSSSTEHGRVTATRAKLIAARDAVIPDTGVLAEITAKFTPDEIYSGLLETHTNSLVIQLLAYAITKFTGKKRLEMINLVEIQKDLLLGSTRFDVKMNGLQAMTTRSGLHPKGPCEKITDILGEYSNWAEMAADGEEIVVINLTVGTPMQFDLRGLIDLEYITSNDMKTSPLSGVTKKVLERFNTASILPGKPSAAPAVEIFPGKEPGRRIFQLITDEYCREMTGNEQFPRGISGRPHSYNRAQQDIIMTKCFDSHAATIAAEYEVAKAAKFDSGVVRAAISDKMVLLFSRNISGAKSLQDLRDYAIDTGAISGILVDTLVMSTGLRGRKSAEHIITYLSKFDGVIRAFIKELEKRWAASGLTNKIFTEYVGDKFVSYVTSVYQTTVNAALDELDKVGAWSEYDMSVKEYFLDKKLV